MEQVGEKRSTTFTHMDANCLLKHTFTKGNKYVVNQKLDHVDDISFIEQNKIRPRTRYVYLQKNCWTISLNLSFNVE